MQPESSAKALLSDSGCNPGRRNEVYGLHDDHFRFKFDVKELLDFFLYRLRECPDLLTAGTAGVDDDERVVIIGSDLPFRFAFEACELDKLSRGELDARRDGIPFELRISDQQELELLLGHYRILEETSCRAYLGPVRELPLPDLGDDARDVLGRYGDGAFLFLGDDILDIVVLRVRDIMLAILLQDERDGGDDDLAFEVVLEDAVAIAELALGIRPDFFLLVHEVDAFDFVDDVFGLFAVCADIADGRCAYGAGDEDEILCADVSAPERPHHDIMPRLACFRFDIDVVVVFPDDLLTFERYLDDEPFIILREEDIRAASEDEMGLGGEDVGGDQIQYFVLMAYRNEKIRFRIDGECIVRFQ